MAEERSDHVGCDPTHGHVDVTELVDESSSIDRPKEFALDVAGLMEAGLLRRFHLDVQ